MAVRRLSISVPPETGEAIRSAAESAGVPVSVWLARVAEQAALIEEGRRAVREFEAECGPIPQEARREAREALARHGLLDRGQKAG